MSRPLVPRLWLLTIACWLVASVDLDAQTAPKVFYACYEPFLGLVYRIKETGLAQKCLKATHIEFNWNEQGPKGDQGPAGNLQLAGQICPAGQFVLGFSSAGNITCGPVSGGAPPPSDLVGVWSLEPIIRTQCTGSPSGLFPATLIIHRVTTSVPEPGTVGGHFDSSLDGWPFDRRFSFFSTTLEFAGTTLFRRSQFVLNDASSSFQDLRLGGTGFIEGRFSAGALTFTLELRGLNVSGTFVPSGTSDGQPVAGQCADVTASVFGVRVTN